MKLEIKRLHPDAVLPMRAHPGDAGLDLYATEGSALGPGERRIVPTGVAIAIPEGYVGLIMDRSGLAAKHGITNLGGVIDSGYRGEWKVIMLNTSDEPYEVASGERIAQMLVVPIALPEVCEVSELDATIRGEGHFGSTGRQ
ncbi:MAG: dUTP diphosphatase [Candidatus Moranbacteria bacterium]|nr:dUTP diphosphatase [Candidatus Moranbacteria bacterium]